METKYLLRRTPTEKKENNCEFASRKSVPALDGKAHLGFHPLGKLKSTEHQTSLEGLQPRASTLLTFPPLSGSPTIALLPSLFGRVPLPEQTTAKRVPLF